MTITIRPEHKEFIAAAIQAGKYQNPNAVIDRALEVLRLEEDWLDANRVAVGEKIDRAFAHFEPGEFYSPEGSKTDLAIAGLLQVTFRLPPPTLLGTK